MPVDIDSSTHFNMRMTPRTRYFLELASRTHDSKLSEYVEAAVIASFKTICVDPLDELSDPTAIGFREGAHSLFDQMEALWSEFPIGRLEAMCTMGYTYLMSDEELTIWTYLFTQPKTAPNGKLDRRYVAANWQTIKAEALAAKKAEVAQ
ncbi:hypothetical protein [Granulicella arctica]|uniref:Uncharacterized protein n=1 Tax=Granulicella arctica TaxID=940613 RepID=A0A7Y9PIK3_9BACT|nr:hypothetical protein [Granulicella arctica]NYF80570.1 hypothetical protein [Granulicella arctica]